MPGTWSACSFVAHGVSTVIHTVHWTPMIVIWLSQRNLAFTSFFFFFFLTLFNYIQKFQDNSLTRRAKKSVSHFLCSTARHREGSSPGPTTWVSHVPSNTRTWFGSWEIQCCKLFHGDIGSTKLFQLKSQNTITKW